MSQAAVLFAMLKADFLERTRRSSFVVILCLIIYMGYAVNSGQILIRLDQYRGIYNSAWVGSLMALVITFFLGIFGFYLVKNSIDRDERTGVGQILATTPLTRAQYLLGKWLSNFAVLTTLVGILAIAAILMQIINREDAQINVWALIAPLLFIALPMMALVSAIAVLFETIRWLKGGFGNLVYFFVFIGITMAGIMLTGMPWLDVTGLSLVGTSMKDAARAVFPGFKDSFVLGMVSGDTMATFVWNGLNWTPGLIVQRVLWVLASIGIALSGSIFFNRFDPVQNQIMRRRQKQAAAGAAAIVEETGPSRSDLKAAQLTPLVKSRFHFNFFKLAGLECLLLVKGLKWYMLAGMAVLWLGCVFSPFEGIRKFWFMVAAIWPVLIWSKMGEREVRYQAESFIYQAAYPLVRLVLSSWVAGVLITAAATSGVLIGRGISGEPLQLTAWVLAVLFIPTLGLTMGTLSRSSKLFEVVYPILWYLGPFNSHNELASLDYLGIHAASPAHNAPWGMAGFILLMLVLTFAGKSLRRR